LSHTAGLTTTWPKGFTAATPATRQSTIFSTVPLPRRDRCRTLLERLLGRSISSDDVEDILCGPASKLTDRRSGTLSLTAAGLLRRTFMRAIDGIMQRKEEDESEK